MISPQENQEDYQRALAWVGEQITAAERQGLTLEYLGGWHRFKPNTKALEKAWRVLYGIPDSMTHLLTCPQEPWEQGLLRWLRHRGPAQDRGGFNGGGVVCGGGGGRVPSGTR
jgi:hypothetical protein